MNARQRVLTTLDHKEPDRVPIGDWIDEPTIVRLAEFLGIDGGPSKSKRVVMTGQEQVESLDLLWLVMQELGIDAVWLAYSKGLSSVDDEYARDKYGRVYHLNDQGIPMITKGAVEEPGDLVGYDMASKLELADMMRIEYMVEKMGHDGVLFLNIQDPFWESLEVRGGMEEYLLDFYDHPELVHGLGGITTEHAISAVDMGAEIGVEVIVVTGDLGSNETTLISPLHYRQYIKPYHAELVDHAHRKGLKVIKHTDGNVWPIIDDFIEVGFDGLNPIQPQCMDIAQVKEHLAGRMALMGNIDCTDLLPSGTPEQVSDVVEQTIRSVAPGGGYILASSNSLHPDCKPENIVAMIEVAHRFGAYPVD